MKLQLLGGLTAQEFLGTYWQKKPLLIRNAIPGFAGLLKPRELFALAGDEDVESRYIEIHGDEWRVERGPFAAEAFEPKPHPWTVLVQGLNMFLPSGDALMRRFGFVPYARLDDLMVSYATDGGGVGPHFDSYDVFLLQGMGRRRWQISAQRDRTLVEDVPLKILRNFKPTHDWVLEPGDMLYLPPHWAHNGIAEGECMTYSIGFRTPSAQELVTQFLVFLQDHLELDGMYKDPDLKPAKQPGEVRADMLEQVIGMIGRLRWNKEHVRDFLGCYLTEPKPHVYFSGPDRLMRRGTFAKRCAASGVALDLKTQFLFSRNRFYMNGDLCEVPAGDRPRFIRLANERRLGDCAELSEAGLDLLYEWYGYGFLSPAT